MREEKAQEKAKEKARDKRQETDMKRVMDRIQQNMEETQAGLSHTKSTLETPINMETDQHQCMVYILTVKAMKSNCTQDLDGDEKTLIR